MSLLNLLAKMFPSPAYTLVTEVANATGAGKSRSADAIAVGCWPSRGLTITGFELKAGRGDWIKELRTPEKSMAIQKYCDHWYLVTATEGVADISEIPAAWGWLAAKNGRLKTMKAPPILTPSPIDRGFLASLLRTGNKKGGLQDVIDTARREAEEAAYQRGADSARRHAENYQKQLNALISDVKRFEDATGLRVETFDLPRIGEAVKIMLGRGVKESLEYMHNSHEKELEVLKKAIAKLNKEK